MPFKDPKYKENQSILKVFGYGENKKIKVIKFSYLRTSGIECDEERNYVRGTVNSSKLDESIRRAKSVIFEYAFCNPWDWFFTGTINGKKHDRTDLNYFHKQITRWIRSQAHKYQNGDKIDFLFVPELHSDGKSWHIHGLLRGVPEQCLKQFCIGDKMGKAIADKVKQGETVYNWLDYSEKFGFCDLEPIRNAEAVSKYITKYISKGLASSVTDLNAHLYYHSRGLKKADVIKKGFMSANIKPDYESEHCSVAWLPYSDELLEQLSESFE